MTDVQILLQSDITRCLIRSSMALVFMDRQGKEIYPYYRRKIIDYLEWAVMMIVLGSILVNCL